MIITTERLVGAVNTLRHLKSVYYLIYIALCLIFSLLHFIKHSSSYTQLVALPTLNLISLRSIVEWRGMLRVTTDNSTTTTTTTSPTINASGVILNQIDDDETTNERDTLEIIIKSSG